MRSLSSRGIRPSTFRHIPSDESILTGRARINGRAVAFIVNEFGFLAGSIGRAAAERIVAAIQRATDEGLPLLASSSSGGTRMQEGTPAFVKMIDISRAVMQHRQAGLPYLAYLRHPTTGGVFASWGSLAHVTVAEPGALVGFLGPKVYELLNGRPFPPGVQQSENLVAHGIIDGVLTAEELPLMVDKALTVLCDPPLKSQLERRAEIDLDALDARLVGRQPGHGLAHGRRGFALARRHAQGHAGGGHGL